MFSVTLAGGVWSVHEEGDSIPKSRGLPSKLTIHIEFLFFIVMLAIYFKAVLYIFKFIFVYSYVHTLFGSFFPPTFHLLPLPSTLLASRQNLFCPYL
jgi:hypothetical protein